MKFVCNHCGFSADIPSTSDKCPMCGSQDTKTTTKKSASKGNAAKKREASKKQKEVKVKEEKDSKLLSVEPEKSKSVKKEGVQKNSADSASLSGEFFSTNPKDENQEILDIIQEISEGETKQSSSLPKYIVIAAIIAFGTVFYFLTFKDDDTSEESSKPIKEVSEAQEIRKAEDKKVEIPKEAVKQDPDIAEKSDKKGKIVFSADVKKDVESKDKKIVKPGSKVAKQGKMSPGKPLVKKKIKKKLILKKKPARIYKKTKHVKKMPEYKIYIRDGNKAIMERRFKDAIHLFKAAISVKKSAARAYRGLGIAYASVDNFKKSCINYRKYLKYNPAAKDKSQVLELLKSCK